ACPRVLAAGRGRGARVRLLGAPGESRVHDAALPGRGRDEPAHDRSGGPEIRHRGGQGHGDPDRQAARGRALMDLHLMTAQPTDEERRAVDALLGPAVPADDRVVRGGHETEGDRTLLLPALHALHASEGWISEGGLNYVCERLTVPPAEAYGVATFYAMFSVEDQPANVVHVCDDLACRVQGGRELLDACREEFSDATASVVASPCLGQCEKAPAVLLQRAGEARGDVVLTDIAAAPHHVAQAIGDEPVPGAVAYTSVPAEATYQGDRLLARVGESEVTTLDGYRARGGYAALARALELGPDEVIRQITDAKLLGRGGAAFPTGVKWRGVADQQVTPKYVIC